MWRAIKIAVVLAALGYASQASAATLNLSWTNNSTAQTGVAVDRCTGSMTCSNFTTIANLGVVASFSDTTLSEGQIACYRVRATIQAQAETSVPSNVACATAITAIIVKPPSGLTVTNPPAVPQ